LPTEPGRETAIVETELVLFGKKNFAIAEFAEHPWQTKPGKTGRSKGMRKVIAMLTGNPWLLRRMVVLVMLIAVGTGAFYAGKRQNAKANPDNAAGPDFTDRVTQTSSPSGRVCAYLYDKVPVSREEFGEYLIARVGPERLDFMLNRKIVETECRKHGIFANDAEVDARFEKELGSFGATRLTKEEFVNSILKRFNKTLYEWREDVIRPKLMMEKLVRPTIKITDKDIQDSFEARFGPQVEVRMIVLDRDNIRLKAKIWEEARKGKEAFMDQAKKQPIPHLAMEGGKVPPIHRHFGDKSMEDAAFALKEGEVSSPIDLKDGSVVILLCEKQVPANKTVTMTGELRTKLYEEMFEMRVQQRIPEVFREMRHFANPRPVLVENAIQLTSHTPPPLPELPKSTVPAPTQTIHIPAPPTPGEVVVPKGLEVAPILPSVPLPAPKDIPPPMPTAVTPMPMPTVATPMAPAPMPVPMKK